MSRKPDLSSRYSRHHLLAELGPRGQERLEKARVTVVGLGALGSVQAGYLARAGVGHLRLIDRDTVELCNLQRQVLYTEKDAIQRIPKAIAAERHLREINSEIRLESIPEHLGVDNVEDLLSGSQVVLDGTDNLDTRFLINDYCVHSDTPWIYGACVATEGLCAVIVPGLTPCFRCWVGVENAETEPTCDTVGVLGPLPGIIGSFQVSMAIRLLSGTKNTDFRGLVRVDAWGAKVDRALTQAGPDPDCACCGQGRFDFLEGRLGVKTNVLCGRNAVQLAPRGNRIRNLEGIEQTLSRFGKVKRNPYLLEARIAGYLFSVFADGRVIVSGTHDPEQARALVDRYLGG